MSDALRPRPPQTDPLLTPQNAVLALIDYQPEQYRGVHSVDHDELLLHVTTLGEIATAYALPVVLSTVFVQHGMSATNAELLAALPGLAEIDRTSMNAWEDEAFRAAIVQTGRRKLIVAGLWSEICVAFPVLDALREGYEVYVVADAIGGVSPAAHQAAMQRMVQAGAVPISVIGLAGELQRDWAREDTAPAMRRIMRSYFAGMAALRRAS